MEKTKTVPPPSKLRNRYWMHSRSAATCNRETHCHVTHHSALCHHSFRWCDFIRSVISSDLSCRPELIFTCTSSDMVVMCVSVYVLCGYVVQGGCVCVCVSRGLAYLPLCTGSSWVSQQKWTEEREETPTDKYILICFYGFVMFIWPLTPPGLNGNDHHIFYIHHHSDTIMVTVFILKLSIKFTVHVHVCVYKAALGSIFIL